MFKKNSYQYKNFQNRNKLQKVAYILKFVIFDYIPADIEIYKSFTDNYFKFEITSNEEFIIGVKSWEKMSELFQTEKINSGEYISIGCDYNTCDYVVHRQVFELYEIPDGVIDNLIKTLK